MLGLALAALLAPAPSRAQGEGGAAPDPDAARRARVALRVGDRSVTVGELEDHLASIPPFQLRMFGDDRAAIARAFVDQVLARDLVLAGGAEKRGLDREPPTSNQLDRALSNATLRAVRRELKSPAAIPAEDVRRYYDEHKSRFESPRRVNLWRILTKTREEASAVLEEARREPTTQRFGELARERSLDKATNLRSGNLGFVAPDGTSNEAGLKVDPALVEAAEKVQDGELVPQPVAEGEHFAVVWRRATVPANKRSLEEATAQIQTTLYRQRVEAAEKKLMADLRAKHVREVNADLLKIVELRPFDAGLSAPRAVAPAGSR